MRRGMSLLELLLAIAVSGLLLGIALPRLSSLRDHLMVDEEVRRLVSAHRRARITAILQSTPVVLSIGPESLTIHAASEPDVGWEEAGPTSRGVELAGGSKRLTFSPVGITTGVSNASFTLSRGAAARTVVVSRLGRLRVR
ncbi:MAG: GspH/FimT family pseudopilin [Gemmatimonadales bacterium]